jgi:hypothetical protein
MKPKLKKKMDGKTWLVSIIHPSYEQSGSVFPSERAGGSPEEAAKSYVMDSDDNVGSALLRSDPEMTIIAVMDPQLHPSGKMWKTHLFIVKPRDHEYDYRNPRIVRFS